MDASTSEGLPDLTTMGFEMHARTASAHIDHHEEAIFRLAAERPEAFPELLSVHAAYYADPIISDQATGRIVHELIDMLDVSWSRSKVVFDLAVRLLPFFSRAARNGTQIRCRSD